MTTATNTKPTFSLQPSLALRAGIAAAAVAFVAGAWLEAGRSSEHAVQEARAAMSRTYVTLPPVQVMGRREAPARVAAVPGRRAAVL